MKHTAGDGDMHRVDVFTHPWSGSPTDEQLLVHQIKACTLPLHQPEVVEDPGQSVVTATKGVKDVGGGNTNRQPTHIYHFQPVWVKVDVDIPSLGIGAVDQGVDQQLAHHGFFVGRHLGAEHALGKFVALAEVGNLFPDGIR